jgi:hypothetical protein
MTRHPCAGMTFDEANAYIDRLVHWANTEPWRDTIIPTGPCLVCGRPGGHNGLPCPQRRVTAAVPLCYVCETRHTGPTCEPGAFPFGPSTAAWTRAVGVPEQKFPTVCWHCGSSHEPHCQIVDGHRIQTHPDGSTTIHPQEQTT